MIIDIMYYAGIVGIIVLCVLLVKSMFNIRQLRIEREIDQMEHEKHMNELRARQTARRKRDGVAR